MVKKKKLNYLYDNCSILKIKFSKQVLTHISSSFELNVNHIWSKMGAWIQNYSSTYTHRKF